MNNTRSALPYQFPQELHHMIEPLASFICATEQPEIALKSVLESLYIQVQQTNHAAHEHVAAILQSQATASA